MAPKLFFNRFWLGVACLFIIVAMQIPKSAAVIPTGSTPTTPNAAALSFPFTSKVTSPDSAVGNISLGNMTLTNGSVYPALGTNDNISLTPVNVTFEQTTTMASFNNSAFSGANRMGRVYFDWLEYLNFTKFDNTTQSDINYSSSVPQAVLQSVAYNSTSGWSNLSPANSTQFNTFTDYSYNNTISNTLGRQFVDLNLTQMNPVGWTPTTNASVLLCMNYSYSLPITAWQVLDNVTDALALPNANNNFHRVYYETFRISDPDLAAAVFTGNIFYVPAYGSQVQLLGPVMAKNIAQPTYAGLPSYAYTLGPDNTLNWTTTANNDYQIYFSADISVKFQDMLVYPFTIDRLVESGNIRERYYIINVSAGPSGLVLHNLNFTDTGIAYQEVLQNSTFLGRSFNYDWDNVTPAVNVTVNVGVNFTVGFLAVGEADAMILQYAASGTINLVVADDIQTPVPDADVTLFLNNATYGTYLSNDLNLSLAPKTTDANGTVTYSGVPQFGNYTVLVQYAGNVYGPFSVLSNASITIVTTFIPHLPYWVFLWVAFCGVIFVIGALVYRKNRSGPQPSQ